MEHAFGQSFGYDSQMFLSLYRDLKSYYKVCGMSVFPLLLRCAVCMYIVDRSTKFRPIRKP